MTSRGVERVCSYILNVQAQYGLQDPTGSPMDGTLSTFFLSDQGHISISTVTTDNRRFLTILIHQYFKKIISHLTDAVYEIRLFLFHYYFSSSEFIIFPLIFYCSILKRSQLYSLSFVIICIEKSSFKL